MTKGLKIWIIISVLINLLWNYAVFKNLGGSPIFIGMIAYFFTLYKITKIRMINPWLTFFGILNIFGLLIVVVVPKEFWGNQSKY